MNTIILLISIIVIFLVACCNVSKIKAWWGRFERKKLLVSSGIILAALVLAAPIIVLCVRYTYMHGTCGKYGDNVKWSCDDSGTLTIYGEGDMQDFHRFSGEGNDVLPSWIDLWWVDIREVVIEEGVTSIGDWAFFHETTLVSVRIPGSVAKIGERAFEQCENLESVTIPEGVIEIGDMAFNDCYDLRAIDFPASLRQIGSYAFMMTGLREVKIPMGTETIGYYAFHDCKDLRKIIFVGMAPNWKLDDEEKKKECFSGVTAVAYYPRWNETWENYPIGYLRGDIEWVSYTDLALID